MGFVTFGPLTQALSGVETGTILTVFALCMAAVLAVAAWVRARKGAPRVACLTMLGVHLATAVLYGSGLLRVSREMLDTGPMTEPGVVGFLGYWMLWLVYLSIRCNDVASCILTHRQEGKTDLYCFWLWADGMVLASAAVSVATFATLSGVFCVRTSWRTLLFISLLSALTATLGGASLHELLEGLLPQKCQRVSLDAPVPRPVRILSFPLFTRKEYLVCCELDCYYETHLSMLRFKGKPLWELSDGSPDERLAQGISILEHHHKVKISTECLDVIKCAYDTGVSRMPYAEYAFRILDLACEQFNRTDPRLKRYRKAEESLEWADAGTVSESLLLAEDALEKSCQDLPIPLQANQVKELMAVVGEV